MNLDSNLHFIFHEYSNRNVELRRKNTEEGAEVIAEIKGFLPSGLSKAA